MSTLKTYAEDLESDAFDPEEYVERLAWRLTGAGENPIDAAYLHSAFEEEIGNLQILSDQCQTKITRLKDQCREEEEEYYVALERLQGGNDEAVEKLKHLNERINAVAAKVVHLGDQLQSVNAPRSRAFESLQLMKHFNEFLADQPLESEVFTDPDRLLESAEIINKLSLIAQELPSEKFAPVQSRIGYKYDEVEHLLIEEFIRMQQAGNKPKMKEIAAILSQFKGYAQCLDAFVEQCQWQAYRGSDVFADTLALCEKCSPLIEDIFPSPQQVMSKLVLNLFHGKLQEYVQGKLSNSENDLEQYLLDLYEVYTKTQKLCTELAKLNVSTDQDYLPMLTRSLFGRYLDAYIEKETKYLRDQCSSVLNRYYNSKGHQKKAIQSGGGYQDFKRDIQARFIPESFGDETFLSEEVAINILQETKQAFQRCQSLSGSSQISRNVELILDILVQHLCIEHIDYAVEFALYGVPLGEPRAPPDKHFFRVVRQTAGICHLFEKQYDDSIEPLVKNTVQQESCLKKKRGALHNLEQKMNNGLDRMLNAILGYGRFVLSNEQKKNDFKPEGDEAVLVPLCSNACSTVVKYIAQQIEEIRDSLDGGNLEANLSELGVRFHRIIVEHIYQFQYNAQGAMMLLCDVNEYRKCISSLKIPLVNKLFEVLHALCNLLVVPPEHLLAACTADLLGDVDRTVVSNFVQLRADYKSAKLYNDFR